MSASGLVLTSGGRTGVPITELSVASAITDGFSNSPSMAIGTDGNSLRYNAFGMAFNGTSWDKARTPNVFKHVQATAAGSTALWTPGAGKKFRLMGYYVSMTANAGAAGALAPAVDLLDGAGLILRVAEYFTPAGGGAAAGHFPTGAVQLGNGYLSTAANNVLNVSLTNTVTAGSFRAIAWGTEE